MPNVDNAQKIAVNLRRLAKEIEETAVGSSRVLMYRTIAHQIREEAAKVELFASVGTAEFRATRS